MKYSVFSGSMASLSLIVIYMMVVSLVSGWNFMLDQFTEFWYFLLPLAVGFGIQVGLYTHLKDAIRKQRAQAPAHVLAVSGTTSTAAMISCCAHYLVNVLPVLGTVGILSVIAQYQIQFFWVGLFFNLGGIVYMIQKVRKFHTHA